MLSKITHILANRWVLALPLAIALAATSVIGVVGADDDEQVSSTVSVPGTAALANNPQGTGASTPAVDSGLNLTKVDDDDEALQVTASGSESPFAGWDNYPDGCCFNAQFVDALGNPIVLPAGYIATRLCDVNAAWPCSTFYPITPSGIVGPNFTGTNIVHTSAALPVPAGAVALLYGHFDSFYGDNSSAMTVTTAVIEADDDDDDGDDDDDD